MGLFSGKSPASKTSGPQSSYKKSLPTDRSSLVLQTDPCHCVSDIELENRYNFLRAEEHARIEGKCGPEWSQAAALEPQNLDRNRYNSIIPWDHSRVRLPVMDGHTDYINASWIQLGSRTYIAAQGPLPSTMHDFWQMVYAYGGEPAVIIMLTPLYEHSVEKCAKYWPDTKNIPLQFPAGERGFNFGLSVHMQKTHQHEHYVYSSFILQPTDKSLPSRLVHHVYYHSWLDYSKPNADADLRALIHFVNNKLRNPGAPPIVHCSAGIGRTGTFIAVDSLISKIDPDIRTPHAPDHTPVWLGDPSEIVYKATPFNGAVEEREKAAGSSASSRLILRSHFDMEDAVSRSHSETQEVNSPKTASDLSLKTKIDVPADVVKRESYLTAALQSNLTLGGALDSSDQCSDAADSANPSEVDDSKVWILQEGTPESPYEPQASSTEASSCVDARKGPEITRVQAKTTNVSDDVLRERPDTVDVTMWFDHNDPIMSAIRTMRKQRPKMVQGKKQLGYIYDQFEVAQQLARVFGPEHGVQRRHSTTALTKVSEGRLSGNSGAPSSRSPISSSSHSHHKVTSLFRSRTVTNLLGTRNHASPSSPR